MKNALSDEERYYVSLFGLRTTEEIHSAVFAAMYPNRSGFKKIAESMSGVSAGIPNVASIGLGGAPAAIANALLRGETKTDRVLVFDDLERCGLSLRNTLGVINQYLEHHRCNVVVIANEDKISKLEEAKEKIFGQTFNILPQIETAFGEFCVTFPSARLFCERYGNEIIEVFKTSQCGSLRILRHVVEDLGRLREHLTDIHLGNEQAMKELVRLFSALNIEVRAGHLKPGDIQNRFDKRTRALMSRPKDKGQAQATEETPERRFSDICSRYDPVQNLTSGLLSDETLIAMLFGGVFNKEAIQTSLNNSAYFLTQEAAPPWKVFIQFDRFEDNAVNEAMHKLSHQFENREISNSGEMLHLFSLRMMMAYYGLIDSSVEAVANDCIAYIDDLLEAKRLPARELDWQWEDAFDRSFGGFGYYVLKEYQAEFNKIYDRLVEARTQALESQYPAIAAGLARELGQSGENFFLQVCVTRAGNNPYALIPVLKGITAEDFVQAWMKSHPRNWYWITSALNERYKGRRLFTDLREETTWLKVVISLLNQKAQSTVGITQLRLKGAIPREAEAALAEVTGDPVAAGAQE